MHNNRLRTLCAALLFTTAAFAQAADTASLGVGLQVGSTGIGGDIGVSLTERIGARVGYSGYRYTQNETRSSVDYQGKLTLSNFRLLGDVGLGAGFRISAGLVAQANKFDLTGQATNGNYVINGRTYQASDIGSLTGNIKYENKVAPYLGLGYGTLGNRGPGLGFYADIGAFYQGKSKTTLNITCGPALPAAQCAQLQSDGQVEATKVNNDANKAPWYPVVSLGLYYNF